MYKTPVDPSNLQSLGEILDLLNAELAQAELGFTAMRLGVSAEVDLSGSRRFGFGKLDMDWVLYVRKDDLGSPKTEVRSTSMQTRIEAAQLLGQLRTALLDSSEEHLQKAREAVLIVRAFNETLLKELPED